MSTRFGSFGIDHQNAFLALVRRGLILAGKHHPDVALGAVFVLDRHVGPLQPVGVLHLAVRTGPALRLFRDAARSTTDVEGPQGELRTRFADGLRGQNADCLAHVHHVHGGQVPAVAHPADTAPGLTGEDRANPDLLDPGIVDRVGDVLVDQLAGLDQQLGIAVLVQLVRIEHVLTGHAAENALAERLDDVLALLECRDLQTQNGPAVLFGDRHVLGDVYQPAGQVAGVGRLERRVGQTLPGAVGRDEVLEHGEPFAEVRLDRALDDLADASGQLLLRLGHQTAHAGELPDLVPAAAGTGVEHHEHRIEPAAASPASS